MRECANSKDFWQINFFIIRILLYNQYSCPSSSIRHKRCMCRIMPEGLRRWRKSRWLVIHHFRDETWNKIRRKRGAGIERHRRQKQARKLVPPALIFLFFSSRLFVRIQEQTRLQAHFVDRRDDRRSGCLVRDRKKSRARRGSRASNRRERYLRRTRKWNKCFCRQLGEQRWRCALSNIHQRKKIFFLARRENGAFISRRERCKRNARSATNNNRYSCKTGFTLLFTSSFPRYKY